MPDASVSLKPPTACPGCGAATDRSPNLLGDLGVVVLFCRVCRLHGIEHDPDGVWYSRFNVPNGNVRQALIDRVVTLGFRKAAQETVEAIIGTSIDDPRWERLN